jgi:hypothetical protein
LKANNDARESEKSGPGIGVCRKARSARILCQMSFGDALLMLVEKDARREKSVCRLFVEA